MAKNPRTNHTGILVDRKKPIKMADPPVQHIAMVTMTLVSCNI
jgi:hypothetical protein